MPRSRAIDEAIRAMPLEWFKANPAIYWADFLASAAIGWTTLGLAAMARGWTRAWWLTGAIFALYRAVLVIHEITHRAKRDVPAFRLTEPQPDWPVSATPRAASVRASNNPTVMLPLAW